MEAPVEFPSPALNSVLKLRGFKVSRSKVPKGGPSAFGRRHFYKIVLSIGNVELCYGDRIIQMNGRYLFFANPYIPYAAEILEKEQTGYSCVFTENFIKSLEHLESLLNSPLFKLSGIPVFKLDEQQFIKLSGFFENMITEDVTNYHYKDDLMRNYIQMILHEAMRTRPEEHFVQFNNGLLRIATQFMELLERQFPVENLNAPLKLKTAQDYANSLSIHVNYLNRAVKELTGKSTTSLIASRITVEATALLQQTDWSVADIAYALGFEYPNYFSSFFKKATGNIPKFYRIRKI
ncbi:helix-turn-helix domain-containing protein [Pedobacter gandavensis]|uniref:helix-turn-helix domain-containing protein n=1 Tax=Pedobacter TaxID=84567 RepID=UPI001C98F5DF|nr:MULTISPECIES: helix-turn-helix domain-containing protein [Pedobacter]WGQ10019.1 helix-turn-helix domain-containing protein [Pedobacter gandavensis]